MSGRISRSSPLHPDKEAFNDDWNEFNDLGHSANKFRPIGSNIRSVSCSSVEYPFGFLFVGRISVRFPVRRHCTATRTPSTTTRRSAITSIIPLTNSEHPTRLLGRISVRFPVRRHCTATRTPSTTTRRSAITSIIPPTNSEHPTRLLGRISVRFPYLPRVFVAFRDMDANDLEKYACRRPCTFVPTTPHSTRILVPLCGPHRLGKIGSAYPYALQSPGPTRLRLSSSRFRVQLIGMSAHEDINLNIHTQLCWVPRSFAEPARAQPELNLAVIDRLNQLDSSVRSELDGGAVAVTPARRRWILFGALKTNVDHAQQNKTWILGGLERAFATRGVPSPRKVASSPPYLCHRCLERWWSRLPALSHGAGGTRTQCSSPLLCPAGVPLIKLAMNRACLRYGLDGVVDIVLTGRQKSQLLVRSIECRFRVKLIGMSGRISRSSYHPRVFVAFRDMDANDLEKYACRRPCTFVPTTPHSTRILVPLCGPHRLGKIGSAYPYALQSPGPRVIKQIPRQAHWHVRSNFPFVALAPRQWRPSEASPERATELTGPAQAVLLHLALIGPPLSQPQKVLPRSNNLGGILVFVRPLTDVCYRSFKPRQR
ncbi:hypothetical protein C8R46DRAFT_1030561 [Mycena filopes]|nr:hypothetical protein C8R46DRAFT_1030561 [Mycena filopes]